MNGNLDYELAIRGLYLDEAGNVHEMDENERTEWGL